MVTGIANRILYKMALVPLGNYVFFLAQFQTFGYVVVYFAVLALRRRCATLRSGSLLLPLSGTTVANGFVDIWKQPRSYYT